MRVFLTHTASKDEIQKCNLSVAAYNFSSNLISGGGFDKIYSILPAYVSEKIEHEDNVEIVWSKWRSKNKLFNRLALLAENFVVFRKMPRGASLWVYNVTALNALLLIMLKWFKRSVKVYTIVLDFTPGETHTCFYLYLINHSDGLIKLANSDLFSVKNSVCLPGVVPIDSPQYEKIKDIRSEFLISGILNENISMLSMLLESFSRMPDLTLHITGWLPDDTLQNQYAGFKNIKFHGQVNYATYLSILHRVPFLLSTRNPDAAENQCNFPSKIIEALLHNRVVISTVHYDQLDEIRYFVVGAKVDTFMEDVTRIIHLPEKELLSFANQSELVVKKFNAQVWNNRMTEIENNE